MSMDWWYDFLGGADGDDGFPAPIQQPVIIVFTTEDNDEMPPMTISQLQAAVDLALAVGNEELFMHYSAELIKRRSEGELL